MLTLQLCSNRNCTNIYCSKFKLPEESYKMEQCRAEIRLRSVQSDLDLQCLQKFLWL